MILIVFVELPSYKKVFWVDLNKKSVNNLKNTKKYKLSQNAQLQE